MCLSQTFIEPVAAALPKNCRCQLFADGLCFALPCVFFRSFQDIRVDIELRDHSVNFSDVDASL